MSAYYRIALLLAAVALLLGGCSTRKIPTIKVKGIKLQKPALEKLLASLKVCNQETTEYKALAHLTLTRGEKSYRYRQIYVFKKPSFLRIETIPTAAVYTLNLLIVDGDSFSYYDSRKKGTIRGSLSELKLKDILGIDLELEEFYALISGCIPVDVLNNQKNTLDGYIDINSMRYFLRLTDSGTTYALDKHTLKLAYASLKPKTRNAYFISYQSYKHLNGRLLPDKINIQIPRHNMEIDIEITFK